MSTLKGIVEKAAQIRNDEHYIVGHNKYIDHIKKYDESIYEVAIIFNPGTVSTYDRAVLGSAALITSDIS